MQRLEQAVAGLQQVLASPPRLPQSWRHLVRERLGAVCEALVDERTAGDDTWLSARSGHLHRERDRLLTQLSVLGAMVVDAADIEPVRRNLARLALDIQHHHQRVSDLVYDAVAMEVGGSE